MDVRLSHSQRQVISALLRRQNFDHAQWQPQWLAGDGSDRLFCRIPCRDGGSVLAVLPSPTHPKALREARAGYAIGRHLAARGVPVPACYDFDAASGIILCEDLGDRLLHGVLGHCSAAERRSYYRQAIEALIRLQVDGREGFDPSWCWDTRSYDRQLMVARESEYFRDAFCRDLLGVATFPVRLDDEFRLLAARAGEAPVDFLLHRDFQSRNLMLTEKGVRIIDFQGARLGPLGYDLASLLLDPYASLDAACREELQDYYLVTLSRYITLDPHSFYKGYYCLLLQRNLQILGAFAYLSQCRGKTFFRQFLAPALASLNAHLAARQGVDFPCLRALADESRSRLEQYP